MPLAVSPSLLRSAAVGLLIACMLLLSPRSRLHAVAGSMAVRYDRSRPGRRLQTRLLAAAMPLDPGQWHAAQLLLLAPCAVWAWTLTGSVLTGLSLAAVTLRMAAAALLRIRRHRRDSLLEDATIMVARHLATELGAGAAPAEVLTSLRGGSVLEGRPVAAELVARLEAGMKAGAPLSEAIAAASRAEPRGAGRAALLRLATLAELATTGGAGTLPLARLAAGMLAEREAAAAARATVAELRTTAIAIPALSCVVAVILATAEPSIATAALSLPLLPVLVACAAAGVGGAVLVHRVTGV